MASGLPLLTWSVQHRIKEILSDRFTHLVRSESIISVVDLEFWNNLFAMLSMLSMRKRSCACDVTSNFVSSSLPPNHSPFLHYLPHLPSFIRLPLYNFSNISASNTAGHLLYNERRKASQELSFQTLQAPRVTSLQVLFRQCFDDDVTGLTTAAAAAPFRC